MMIRLILIQQKERPRRFRRPLNATDRNPSNCESRLPLTAPRKQAQRAEAGGKERASGRKRSGRNRDDQFQSRVPDIDIILLLLTNNFWCGALID